MTRLHHIYHHGDPTISQKKNLNHNTGMFSFIIIGIQSLGQFWAGTRAQWGDRYGSGTLHPGQVLRGSLPLLSPAFGHSHFCHQVPPHTQRRKRS